MLRRRWRTNAEPKNGYSAFFVIALMNGVGLIAYALLMFVGVIDGFGFSK